MYDYQKIMDRMAALQYKINSNVKNPRSFAVSDANLLYLS